MRRLIAALVLVGVSGFLLGIAHYCWVIQAVLEPNLTAVGETIALWLVFLFALYNLVKEIQDRLKR